MMAQQERVRLHDCKAQHLDFSSAGTAGPTHRLCRETLVAARQCHSLLPLPTVCWTPEHMLAACRQTCTDHVLMLPCRLLGRVCAGDRRQSPSTHAHLTTSPKRCTNEVQVTRYGTCSCRAFSQHKALCCTIPATHHTRSRPACGWCCKRGAVVSMSREKCNDSLPHQHKKGAQVQQPAGTSAHLRAANAQLQASKGGSSVTHAVAVLACMQCQRSCRPLLCRGRAINRTSP